MDTTYLVDNYVNTKPGEPYRLFPFGKIVKNGRERVITPEYAATFKLPHFKPPVKLGSHNDETPAGGHIIGLEVRGDGLYAIPEWNDKGIKSVEDGAYRYHSPEVIWDDGGLENPENGDFIRGPLILGDAMLHTPHLGEAAKLYSIGDNTMEENIQMPKSFWDKFVAPLLDRKPETQVVEKTPEDYEATKQERDEYKSKLAAIEAEKNRAGRVEKFTAALKETKVNFELSELLADLPEEKADAILKEFKALSAQIDESKLTGETGVQGEAETDPKAAFNAAVLAIAAEKKINYNAAFEHVKASSPDLFKAAFAK
jgi:phage I-like protein